MADVTSHLRAILIASRPPIDKEDNVEFLRAALTTIEDRVRLALAAQRRDSDDQ